MGKSAGWEQLVEQGSVQAKSPRGANRETALMAQIQNAIRFHGLWVERLPVQGVMHKQGDREFLKRSPLAGFPDLLVIGPEGLTAWLEVKTPQGKPTALQLERIRRLESLGHVAAIVRSVEDALTVLKENAFIYCPVVEAKMAEMEKQAHRNPEAFEV